MNKEDDLISNSELSDESQFSSTIEESIISTNEIILADSQLDKLRELAEKNNLKDGELFSLLLKKYESQNSSSERPLFGNDDTSPEYTQLKRYFDQILRVFDSTNKKTQILVHDNELFKSELSSEKTDSKLKLKSLENEHREYIDLINEEIEKIRAENNSIKNSLINEEKEKTLYQKNNELLETKIKHLKDDIEIEKEKDYKSEISSLKDLIQEKEEKLLNKGKEIVSQKEENDLLEKQLEEEISQKNDMISRFRDEIATLEEKHQLKLDRQKLEIEESAFSEFKKYRDSAEK